MSQLYPQFWKLTPHFSLKLHMLNAPVISARDSPAVDKENFASAATAHNICSMSMSSASAVPHLQFVHFSPRAYFGYRRLRKQAGGHIMLHWKGQDVIS